MNKTLYITDLDGTLLSSQECISQYSLDTINGLIAKGMNFSFATARGYTTAKKVVRGLNVTHPVAIHNGAFIIDPVTGGLLSGQSGFFSAHEVNDIKSFFAKNNVNPLVYAFIDGKERVSYLTTAINDGIANYLSSRKDDIRLRATDNTLIQFKGDVFCFTVIDSFKKAERVYNKYKIDDRFIVYFQKYLYADEYWCEINQKNNSKSNALIELKKLFGYDRIVCFGDAGNDISMFKLADECYAVKNACEELKSIATGIIDSNDNDGVARWLEKNIEL